MLNIFTIFLRPRRLLVLFVFLFEFYCFPLFSQIDSLFIKHSITAIRINEKIVLTGKLDDPKWNDARPFNIIYEIKPGDNVKSNYKTTAKILYDDENIYFGFDCRDSLPNQIRANISDRDRIFSDDYVIVVLDTYGDAQKGYEFAINPFGIQGDLMATSNNEDASIDWIWHSAANINEGGWTAEFAIPFKSLSFPEKEEQKWGIGIVRTLPRSSRTQISWMPISRNIPGFLPQLGYLEGLKNIKPGKSIEFLPYVIAERNGKLSDIDNPESGFKFDKLQGRVGFGVKYSPTPSISFDGVINPDFSQIESDADQISVNSTFALYYDEKRPFFLIGRELLGTPMYYSRSINNPLTAIRMSGKANSISYLYMGAYDRNTIFTIPGEEESNTEGTNLKSFANVGRIRYDFGNEKYIGGMLITRNFSSGHNYVAGVDWNYKFWTNWSFSGECFLSNTKELNDTTIINEKRKFSTTNFDAALNGEKYSGEGAHLYLSHSSRSYYLGMEYNSFSPTYQAYNGSFNQTGLKQLYIGNEYIFYPDKFFTDKGFIGLSGNLSYNFYGVKKGQTIEPYFNLSLKAQTSIFISYMIVNDEIFRDKSFKNIKRIHFDISTKPTNEIEFSGCTKIGRFIYRSDNPKAGYGHNINTELTLKPSSQLNLTLSYSRAGLSDINTKELLYDGNIFRLNTIYQFSEKMFLRTILQYNSFSKIFHLYPLFSYKFNAFTTFFAGATGSYHDYEDWDGITNTHQQYFIKFQYLIGV